MAFIGLMDFTWYPIGRSRITDLLYDVAIAELPLCYLQIQSDVLFNAPYETPVCSNCRDCSGYHVFYCIVRKGGKKFSMMAIYFRKQRLIILTLL
ncbi:hypothetical protein CW304_22545 [Bacillus sp. UFRGS-B20]|nr:hypothetical protein CW304_22545 [Bacillus sp. UFRGS-B20]